VSRWLAMAAALGASGVALGAFGAHGLKGRLSPEQLGSWETAVHYQLLHAIALLALALATESRDVQWPAGLLSAGVVLFSGSIYLLVLTPWRWPGPLTPLGGLCLIAGWISLFFLHPPRS